MLQKVDFDGGQDSAPLFDKEIQGHASALVARAHRRLPYIFAIASETVDDENDENAEEAIKNEFFCRSCIFFLLLFLLCL